MAVVGRSVVVVVVVEVDVVGIVVESVVGVL